MQDQTRKEKDLLGALEVAQSTLHGVHTERALTNFPLSGRPVHPALVSAYGYVKLACAQTNRSLGHWADDSAKADAIEKACREMADGLLTKYIVVDALQGGAGTSTNMNVNEVLANRVLEILNEEHGKYDRVSPLADINLHQSTNDTYPTALKLAAILLVRRLDQRLVSLQEAFQAAEKKFAHIVKVGRTQLQDAVLTTVGREMGAYAEAFNRDRWRVYKCEERLRVVNLGGTAIGTGICAPRQYIFRVTDKLRELTGIGFARAEHMVDATQNADVFVEVSGILKACAANLLKVAGDLRLMSSGPSAGFAEIKLPARQAGSSIMPGKVNPVIPEAVSQAAMMVMANDIAVATASSMGSLELNPFLPLVASALLESLSLLGGAAEIFRSHCVEGIEVNEAQCRAHVESSTGILTALLPVIGYAKATELARELKESGKSVHEFVLEKKLLTAEELERLISPESVCQLGSPDTGGKKSA